MGRYTPDSKVCVYPSRTLTFTLWRSNDTNTCNYEVHHSDCLVGREIEKEIGREGEREGGRERGREREIGRGKERERERERERGRERERERGSKGEREMHDVGKILIPVIYSYYC